uniref:sigma-E processing peptidase SpoIIGA n=1 Tax=uncultured Flavonifractor sp. TaxID=1193534 RepID=UPI00345DD54B
MRFIRAEAACTPEGGSGMTVVYLDEVFLLNFVVDYLLLLSAGRLAGEVLRRGRLALGA